MIGSHVYADCHMLARADVNAHLDVPARFGPGSSTRCSLWSGWLSPILECSGASRLRVLGSRVFGIQNIFEHKAWVGELKKLQHSVLDGKLRTWESEK